MWYHLKWEQLKKRKKKTQHNGSKGNNNFKNILNAKYLFFAIVSHIHQKNCSVPNLNLKESWLQTIYHFSTVSSFIIIVSY